jgi:hypothetical protein
MRQLYLRRSMIPLQMLDTLGSALPSVRDRTHIRGIGRGILVRRAILYIVHSLAVLLSDLSLLLDLIVWTDRPFHGRYGRAQRYDTHHHWGSSSPLAPPRIPIFGHMIGFMRDSFAYYTTLRDRIKLPIFTVHMPGRKIYIVTKPELISKVDKKTKVISFAPIISEFSSVTCGTSQVTTDILNHNLFGEHGKQSLSVCVRL